MRDQPIGEEASANNLGIIAVDSAWNLNPDFLATITMFQIMGSNDNFLGAGGNFDAAQGPGKRLLAYMWMLQDPCGQYLPIGQSDLPGVGIMLPARIGVFDGHI